MTKKNRPHLKPASFTLEEWIADAIDGIISRKNSHYDDFNERGKGGRKVRSYPIVNKKIREAVWETVVEYSKSSGISVSGLDHLSVMQYGRNQGYGVHSDISNYDSPYRMRKISYIAQLSNGDEYKGGDVVLHIDGMTVPLPRKKFSGIMFPSWTQHEVVGVSSGTRRSLVCWAFGECWK